MDSTTRLHLATKIHFALIRLLGTGIDVGLMLQRELYALDVINVCRASDDDELAHLAEQFVRLSQLEAAYRYNLSPALAEVSPDPAPTSGNLPRGGATRPVPVRPVPLTPFKVRTPAAQATSAGTDSPRARSRSAKLAARSAVPATPLWRLPLDLLGMTSHRLPH